MSNGEKHIVFVYGTLKKNQRNHYVMMDSDVGFAKFLGMANTAQQYPLIVNAELQVPFLLHLEGQGEYVEGELYEVDDAKLASLDELEGHPNFYQRLVTKVQMRTEGSPEEAETEAGVVECWAYFMTHWRQELLNLPRLKSFSSSLQFKFSPEEKKKRREALKAFMLG